MKGIDLKKLLPRRALAFLGMGVLLWLAVCLLAGPSAVFASIGGGLWAIGTVLALSAAALAFRSAAWKIALAQEGKARVPLTAVLVSFLGIGGTPVRLALLKKRAGVADGAGSVVTDQSVRSVAGLVFAGLGLFFGFLLVPGNGLVRGLMVIAALGGLGYAIAAARGRRGFFTALLEGVPTRILSPAVRGRFQERDRFLSRFRAARPAAFFTALLIHLAVFGLSALEIFAIGRAIDGYFPGALALGLAALIPVMRLGVSFVPAALGVLEGAVALVLALTFGLPLAPVGVAVVFVLRLRTLAWWLVGIAVTGNPMRLLFAR
ncbi:MAG TPA: lysylphosphatidylglycerol synthase domain-containing protein [bacterium]|nr:lysylphosphatidylglycerol synthase domain-containing protein [bacterium]